MPAPLTTRPAPIRDAFKSVGSVIALVGTLIVTAVSIGAITAAQGTALKDLVNAVPVILELVVFVLVAFGVIKRAEPQVTPVVDPAVVVDGELVGLVPEAGQHRRI